MRPRNWEHVPSGHQLRERFARIADHLPGYILDRSETSLVLRSGPWNKILIGLSRDGKRLVFHGIYPAPKPRPSWWVSGTGATITVAATKPDHVIAADIQRRLLPGYLAELADVRQRIHDHDRSQTARRELLDSVLARLPGSWLVEPTTPRSAFIRADRWSNPLLSNVEVRPSHDGATADVTITGAAGPFLDQLLTAIAEALQDEPTPCLDQSAPAEDSRRPEPTAHQYLTAVADILNRPGYWSPDTLDDIAEIVTVAGFPILDNAEGDE